MSDTTNAAAALIRMYAAKQREVAGTYFDLGETEAGNRARGIADDMDYAAELLREKLDPPYDAKAAAANALAGTVWLYLNDLDAKGIAYTEDLARALEAYDAIDDKEN